jgi:hypothetical protein
VVANFQFHPSQFVRQSALSMALNTFQSSTSSSLSPSTITFVNDAAENVQNISSSSNGSRSSSSPKGIILSSYFGFRQDPRHIGKYEHKLATFESMYHFHTTVVHYQLEAIIFHDGIAFNDDFIQKYTHEPYIRFVKVDPPTFDNGEPIISPNDFRYLIFDRFLKNQIQGQRFRQDGYDWYLIADLDVFFNRNPFEKLQEYHEKKNYTFFGSFDGGTWADEVTRLQRKLFRQCYGWDILLKKFREEVEWKTPNGNCGLWAGNFEKVSCVLSCMADQYSKPPVRGKGRITLCGK